MEGITRFEKARLLSARALQLSLGAPPLVKSTGERSMYALAQKELAGKVLPINVVRIFPNGETKEITLT